MADDKRLSDPMRHNFEVACPGCGQRYYLAGLMVQDDEELACSRCNATFKLRIDGTRVEPTLITPPTGSPLGPAEGDRRR